VKVKDFSRAQPNEDNLVKAIHAATPESDLMRCGDVERKPRLRQPDHMGVSDFTGVNLENMLIWKENPYFEDAMDTDGRITGSQVQNHVQTAKSATSALTGEDTLGLRGAL
jgi:hypothetical protein